MLFIWGCVLCAFLSLNNRRRRTLINEENNEDMARASATEIGCGIGNNDNSKKCETELPTIFTKRFKGKCFDYLMDRWRRSLTCVASCDEYASEWENGQSRGVTHWKDNCTNQIQTLRLRQFYTMWCWFCCKNAHVTLVLVHASTINLERLEKSSTFVFVH